MAKRIIQMHLGSSRPGGKHPVHVMKLALNEKFFLRDPQETDLGKKILTQSVQLISKLGFEEFTFQKLAVSISSTEASVYRYFENKHRLLSYLVSWYWQWMDYQVVFKTNNIDDARRRMDIVLHLLSHGGSSDFGLEPLLDEKQLRSIVINEADKFYLTKNVDRENKEGLFVHYKTFVKRIADIILELAPRYPYPRALAGMVVEESGKQFFFAKHLPSLTDCTDNAELSKNVEKMLNHFLFASIEKYKVKS